MSLDLSPNRTRSEFIKKVEEISGQNLHLCYQCGTCSGSCPMFSAMDIMPRRIIHLAQLGLEEHVANSKTIWLCASCLTCSARCPRGVDVAKIMEALRLLTLRKNVDHINISELPKETVAELPQMALVAGFRKLTA